MKTLAVVLLLASAAIAQSIAEAPSFWTLSALAAGSTAADSYSTSKFQARYDYWLHWRSSSADPVFHGNLCMTERNQPWLYGKHPGPARAWEIGAAKLVVAEGLTLGLRRKKSKFWSVPLGLLTADSMAGAVHNAVSCGF